MLHASSFIEVSEARTRYYAPLTNALGLACEYSLALLDKELDKFDRLNETVSFDVLKGENGQNVVIDYNKPRNCPRCANRLHQHYYDKQLAIQIDECLNCKGIWLDPGELNHLRHLNTGQDGRTAYLDKFFKENGGDQIPTRLRAVFGLLFR